MWRAGGGLLDLAVRRPQGRSGGTRHERSGIWTGRVAMKKAQAGACAFIWNGMGRHRLLSDTPVADIRRFSDGFGGFAIPDLDFW